MTELEIEELERRVTGSDSAIVEEAKSVEALPDHVGEHARNVLPEMEAEEQADSLEEEKVVIVMEIAEVIERGIKDKLPAHSHIVFILFLYFCFDFRLSYSIHQNFFISC